MALDPRLLIHLLAIQRHGSFNRAAEELGMSQPALSKSIALLERRVGARVLTRGPRGSALTDIGDALVRHARNLEALLHSAQRETLLSQRAIKGPLSLGATPSMMLRLVPEALARLDSEMGSMAVNIVEGMDDVLLPALINGELDLMVGPIGGLTPMAPEVVEELLTEEVFGLGVAPGHPLAGGGACRLHDLLGAGWVLPGQASAYHRYVEALFRTLGSDWPADCISCNSLAATIKIVSSTQRLTIITRMNDAMQIPGLLSWVPLKGAIRRHIGIRRVRSRELSPLAQRCAALIREVVAESNDTQDR